MPQEEKGVLDQIWDRTGGALADWWDNTGVGSQSQPQQQQQQQQPGGPALRQPSPRELEAGAASTMRPPPPPQAPPQAAQPPLQADPQEPGPIEKDPAKGREIAMQSAEAAKTANSKDKKAINEQLGEMIGGEDNLQDAYEQAIERLGGEKEFDPKLEREDWGLFLLDMGMRMMAASGAWNAQLGGVIGEAGSGALQGHLGRQAAGQERVDEYNRELRETALGLAEKGQRTGADVIWTEKGAADVRTGQLIRGEGGGALQPGMEPGATNRPLQRQVSEDAIYESLVAGGLSEGEARALAQRQAHASAPDVAELKFAFIKGFDTLFEKLSNTEKVPGSGGMTKRQVANNPQLYEQARQAFVDARVKQIYGSGLARPGPASEGRTARSKVGTL